MIKVVCNRLFSDTYTFINSLTLLEIMSMKNIIFLIVLIPFLSFSQNMAMNKKGMDTTKYIPKGLKIGAKAPEINLYSIEGKQVSSLELLKEKQVVIIFYRGEWCPVCERYLSNLNDSLSYIIKENAEVLVIGPETFENANKTANSTNASFTLLPDTSFQTLYDFDVMFSVTKKYERKIKTFLMTDIAKNNNQEEAKLPVPATYIIGKDGLIKWRHFDYNYSYRASAKEIIDNLK